MNDQLLTLLGLIAVVGFGAVVPVVPTGAAVSAAALIARSEHPWEIVLVVAAGALGAYVGDITTYGVLRASGVALAQRLGWLHADDPDGTLRHIRDQIEAHELRTLLVSRLVPGGRIPVLLAAALGGYPWQKFAVASLAATTLWSATYAVIGVLGQALPNRTVALVAVIVAALLVSVAIRGVKWLHGRVAA